MPQILESGLSVRTKNGKEIKTVSPFICKNGIACIKDIQGEVQLVNVADITSIVPVAISIYTKRPPANSMYKGCLIEKNADGSGWTALNNHADTYEAAKAAIDNAFKPIKFKY